jgi:hypothetical protein
MGPACVSLGEPAHEATMHPHPFSVGPTVRVTIVAGAVVLCATQSLPAQISGDNFSSTKLSCAGIKLEKASGLPDGTTRQYAFGGSCRIYQSDGEGQEHAFPVIGRASWDSKTRKLSESLKILGDFEYYDIQVAGSLASIYRCSTDPIVGPAACNGDVHKNETGLEQFSNPFVDHKPLLAGKTTLAEAIKLNQNDPPGNPPPPPPPPGKTPVVRDNPKPGDEVVAVEPAPPRRSGVDSADQSKAPRTVARPKPVLRVPPPPPATRPASRTGR